MIDWGEVTQLGVPMLILAVIGVAIWRIIVFGGRKLFGDERKGTAGLVDAWISNLAVRLATHEASQKEYGDAARVRGDLAQESLRLLVEQGRPPEGTAYVAAQAVYATAVNVEALQAAGHQAAKIFRLIAHHHPNEEPAINVLCDKIEELTKRAV